MCCCPSASIETLVTLEARLARDAEYMKTGAAFLNAPAVQPAYNRIESQLMIAFEKIPGITLPPATATNGPGSSSFAPTRAPPIRITSAKWK